MSTHIQETLLQVVAGVSGIDVDSHVVESSTALRDLGITSLMLHTLIAEIERHFGVEFVDADIRAVNFETVGSTVDVISVGLERHSTHRDG